jgi:hypothetical protein
MDLIPFEKVSIHEAKAVLDGETVASPSRNWAAYRKTDELKNVELTEQAWQWLDQLPQEVQPGSLIQWFPRIINKLAELWLRPFHCNNYLTALMLDHRGTRTGFPHDVAREIALLKDYFATHIAVQKSGIWSEHTGR